MSRKVVSILGIVVIVAVAAAALTVFRTPEEASAPIVALPVVVETSAPVTAAEAAPEPMAAPATEQAPEPTAVQEAEQAPQPEVEQPAEPAAAPTAEPQPAEELAVAEAAAPVIFEIVAAESQARFVINEVLRGSPKTVVGVTDQVSGQLAVNPTDPAASQVGTILINARTLATDSSMRDRALKNWILQTNDYEFVTFEPSEVIGMPVSVAVGEPFSFQLVGNLTVKDLTVPVTFDLTVTPVSEQRLEGLATLTLPHRDLNISIPDSPSVDTVADELTLELEFVAIPASGV